MDRERFIEEETRCPHGGLDRDGYDGAAAAPPGHEEVFDHSPEVLGFSQRRNDDALTRGVARLEIGDAHVLAPGGRLAIATAPGPQPPDNVWGPAMRVNADEELLVLQRRAAFEEVEVGVEGGVRLGVARKRQRPRLLARRLPGFRGLRRRWWLCP